MPGDASDASVDADMESVTDTSCDKHPAVNNSFSSDVPSESNLSTICNTSNINTSNSISNTTTTTTNTDLVNIKSTVLRFPGHTSHTTSGTAALSTNNNVNNNTALTQQQLSANTQQKPPHTPSQGGPILPTSTPLYHAPLQQSSPGPTPPYYPQSSTTSPLSTLSPQQLQSVQLQSVQLQPCPAAIVEGTSVISRLPGMYVYPGVGSTPAGASPVISSPIRPAGPVRSVTPATSKQSSSSANPSIGGGASPLPQSTPLASLPGSVGKTGVSCGVPNTSAKTSNGSGGGASGGEEDPRSPAYSDISDAADAPPGVEGDPVGVTTQVERRVGDPPNKGDQLLLQPPPPPYVGLGVYGGFENPYPGQGGPFLLRYPTHPVLGGKSDPSKDIKSGDEKKETDLGKFPVGGTPFPSGMYPYAGGLGPPPHYTADPYYAHLAAAHAAAVAPPSDVLPPKEGAQSPGMPGQTDKAHNLPSGLSPVGYRSTHPLDPRLLPPLMPGGLPLLPPPPIDKDMNSQSKDGKSLDGSKPDGGNDSVKNNGLPPPTNTSSFYPTPPGFPNAYAFDAFRAMTSGLPSHFPPSPFLPPGIRYSPHTPTPEDLTRSSSNSTSTPPPAQYPHNLTPQKLAELHDRALANSPSTNQHTQSPNKANNQKDANNGNPSSGPCTQTPLADGTKVATHFSAYHQLMGNPYQPPPAHHYAGLSLGAIRAPTEDANIALVDVICLLP